MFGSCLVAGSYLAGIVKHARLESPSAREPPQARRQPHWQALIEGKVHLGWQCWKGEPAGRWCCAATSASIKAARTGEAGRQVPDLTLGLADDGAEADGDAACSTTNKPRPRPVAMTGAPNGNQDPGRCGRCGRPWTAISSSSARRASRLPMSCRAVPRTFCRRSAIS